MHIIRTALILPHNTICFRNSKDTYIFNCTPGKLLNTPSLDNINNSSVNTDQRLGPGGDHNGCGDSSAIDDFGSSDLWVGVDMLYHEGKKKTGQ